MRILAGTSGFSYKEWHGVFYPDELPASRRLHFYSRQLPAVEINNTFYRLPKPELLEGWAKQVPEDFRFVLKASRKITHFKRLADCEDATGYLLATASRLESRLGAVLFQLPPNFKMDLERLTAFLETLPEGTRAAFEFRHPSWFDERVLTALADRKVPLCLADTDEAEGPRIATADWGYLRLRRESYEPRELAGWIDWIFSQDWRESFLFFKHEDAGAGPQLARQALELAAGGAG